jgi:hypothetical protein
MAELGEIIKYWAADREGVSVLNISNIQYDFDKGWPGTDVTPGDVPEIVITYNVRKAVEFRHPASELGDFLTQLAQVASRGPLKVNITNPTIVEGKITEDNER